MLKSFKIRSRDRSPSSPNHLEDVSSRPGDLDLSQLEGLTLYEKKCVLVNREIDAQGMGRYQWYIWCLCGFGYFLDLLWAQAFGLVLGPLKQEMGFSNDQSGNISTSFNAGLTAGAFVWGCLSDIVGMLAPDLLRCARPTDFPGRPQMGFQLDLSLFVSVWPVSWCLEQLQYLSGTDCLRRLWCWGQHPHRHNHHA